MPIFLLNFSAIVWQFSLIFFYIKEGVKHSFLGLNKVSITNGVSEGGSIGLDFGKYLSSLKSSLAVRAKL